MVSINDTGVRRNEVSSCCRYSDTMGWGRVGISGGGAGGCINDTGVRREERSIGGRRNLIFFI